MILSIVLITADIGDIMAIIHTGMDTVMDTLIMATDMVDTGELTVIIPTGNTDVFPIALV